MKKLLIVTIIVVVVSAGLYFSFKNKDKITDIASDLEPADSSAENELAPIEPDPIFAEPVTYSSLNQSYAHANFYFKYSSGFKVLSNPVGGGPAPSEVEGEMITIENEKGSGFQIFIMAWDEPGPITPERIWEDMPDMEITDPKNADLDGAKTLVFNGYDGDFGETFEAWVVRQGKLYQISGPKTAQQLIIETLETWEWK